ncbi:MAG: porin OmpL1 [Leptospira sp.]|nr:porin OmpL1 [Leptospira sp.]
MIKMITKVIFMIAICMIAGTGLSAKTSVIVGGGLQFDLGQLGGTITKDGLDSTQLRTNSAGQVVGPQSAIVAENKLVAVERSTGGAFNVKDNGAMTGGVLSLGVETDVGKNFFARVGINYTEKIAGGYTSANYMGYNWYEITWNYRTIIIPAYFGIKLKVGEDSAFYIAAGVNYYQGGWGLKGHNDGVGLAAASGGISNSLGLGASPAVLDEDTQFKVKGFGVNWLVGAQTKISDKGSLFFELETILSAKMGIGATHSSGGTAALSMYPAYPIVVGGQIYKIGYKHEL